MSRLCATTFTETIHYYGHDSPHRHFRSTVEYRPMMIPLRYSDTQYVLPKRLTSTYVSYMDVCGYLQRPKLYQSSIIVQPVTFSNVVVGGFRWLPDRQADVESLRDGNASSESGLENDNDDDEGQLESLDLAGRRIVKNI